MDCIRSRTVRARRDAPMDDATRDGEDEEESRVDRVDGAPTPAAGDAESEEDATAMFKYFKWSST